MKNWRTTSVGVAAAIVYGGWRAYTTGQITGDDLIIMGSIAALGYVAKDAGQTGVEK